jgi:hypothetical protein
MNGLLHVGQSRMRTAVDGHLFPGCPQASHQVRRLFDPGVLCGGVNHSPHWLHCRAFRQVKEQKRCHEWRALKTFPQCSHGSCWGQSAWYFLRTVGAGLALRHGVHFAVPSILLAVPRTI